MMLARQSGLGRGLGALIPPKPPAPPSGFTGVPVRPTPEPEESTPAPIVPAPPADDRGRILQIPVSAVARNPRQPRQHFDHQQLEDLIASIKEHGVIQPLLVTRTAEGTYELIAGERRLRAATIAGMRTVPAILREDVEDRQKLELALIENVQRQDLNPIEEARAYSQLMDEFHLTQEEIAKKVGKSRPQIANILRLLQLPEVIQRALVEGRISATNGRTLLSLPTDDERLRLFQQMLEGQFTVRQTEARVPHTRSGRRPVDPNVAAIEDALRIQLKCKVVVKRNAKGEGEVRLKFGSDEELQAIVDNLQQ